MGLKFRQKNVDLMEFAPKMERFLLDENESGQYFHRVLCSKLVPSYKFKFKVCVSFRGEKKRRPMKEDGEWKTNI